MDSIRAWIEALPQNIAKVIELEGGNEYQEGRESKRSYRGRRKVGHLYHHAWLGVDGQLEQEAEEEDWEDVRPKRKSNIVSDAVNTTVSDPVGDITNEIERNNQEGQSLPQEGGHSQISMGEVSRQQPQPSNPPSTRVTRSQTKKGKTPS